MTRILVVVVLLILSLAGNVYLGFLLSNAGVIVDNAQSVADQLWYRREPALQIMRRNWVGRSASDVDELAEELNRRGVILGREGELREIGSFLFYVEDGVVVDVQDFDSRLDRDDNSQAKR